MPALMVTVDPVENRGFEYHTGISFTFFARGETQTRGAGRTGRGGRYDAGDPAMPEPATGFTLYTDMILSTLPEDAAAPALAVAARAPMPALAAALRDPAQGAGLPSRRSRRQTTGTPRPSASVAITCSKTASRCRYAERRR